MSSEQDITKKTQTATIWADCRTESENRANFGRAYDEDAIDMIHHHIEWGREKERGAPLKTDQEPDSERGMIPSNEPRCIRQ